MELFSLAWFGSLASIVAIDLVLAGDNAVVIALAARTLSPKVQRRAVIWGTLGAIIVRIIAAAFAVYLLKINGVAAIGGLLLFWIAYGLVKEQAGSEGKSNGAETTTFWAAMRTIIVADALMGLDNVLAIAGAARGDFLLVVIGLFISIPIVMGGSILILKFIKGNPWIIWAGGALLGYTGASMIFHDPFMAAQVFEEHNAWFEWTMKIIPAVFLFMLGWWFHRLPPKPAMAQDPGT